MRDKFSGIVGCGALCAFIVSSFAADETLQAIMFLFGSTYGGLWILHE